MDSPISVIIGNFEFALGRMGGIWLVVEAAVSERTAQTLVEEQEQKSDLKVLRRMSGTGPARTIPSSRSTMPRTTILLVPLLR